jgi:hypothetical protein
MPARKGNNARSNANDTIDNIESDQKLYKFVKDEIVWAKMKFFSAWPAKVGYLNLLKIKMANVYIF